MAAVPLRSLMAKAAGPKRARRKAAISPLRCGCEPQAIRSTATTQRERQRLRRDFPLQPRPQPREHRLPDGARPRQAGIALPQRHPGIGGARRLRQRHSRLRLDLASVRLRGRAGRRLCYLFERRAVRRHPGQRASVRRRHPLDHGLPRLAQCRHGGGENRFRLSLRLVQKRGVHRAACHHRGQLGRDRRPSAATRCRSATIQTSEAASASVSAPACRPGPAPPWSRS